MDAAAFHRDDDGRAVDDTRWLVGEELDRRIRAGWEEWCDLLEGLVGSGGMLPSRELAGRVVGFFEDAYWRAEEARIEALRQQLTADRVRRRDEMDRAWGLG
jgi:hypothetical protein